MVTFLPCKFLPYHPPWKNYQDPDFALLPPLVSLLWFAFPFFLFAWSCVWLDLSSFQGLRRSLWRHTLLAQKSYFSKMHSTSKRTCRSQNYTCPSLKQQKLEKLQKIVCQVKDQTWQIHSPLWNSSFPYRCSEESSTLLQHTTSPRTNHVLIPLNITHQCKLHYRIKGNLWCSEDLVNSSCHHLGGSYRCWHPLPCIVSSQPLLLVVTFWFPPPVLHMFQQPGLQPYNYTL